MCTNTHNAQHTHTHPREREREREREGGREIWGERGDLALACSNLRLEARPYSTENTYARVTH